jgi:hypothetical protein
VKWDKWPAGASHFVLFTGRIMKKAAWTIAMAGGGFMLGLKSADPRNIVPWDALIGAAWVGSIGYGFGTIFDVKRAQRPIVAAWTMTLALVGIFFGMLAGVAVNPYLAGWEVDVAGVVGACSGAIFGYVVGRIQRRRILASGAKAPIAREL